MKEEITVIELMLSYGYDIKYFYLLFFHLSIPQMAFTSNMTEGSPKNLFPPTMGRGIVFRKIL